MFKCGKPRSRECAYQTFLLRILHLILVFIIISLGVFALFALAPGDPAEILLSGDNESAGREQIAALHHELGMDRHWVVRYFDWLFNVLQGDFGASWRTGEPVIQEIKRCVPATLSLATASFVLALLLSTTAGTIAAFKKNRFSDKTIRICSVICISLPNYCLGLLLTFFFALKLDWLPVMGRGNPAHLILPAVTLALAPAAFQGRILRSTLLQVMEMDFIRFAYSKGLKPGSVFFRHMLVNILPPMAAIWGVMLGNLMGGAVIVESIFAWPGLGRLTVQGILARDVPLIQAIILMLAFIFVIINQLTDAINRKVNTGDASGI